ncbi:MAG: acetyl-CoA acetyltransferase [Hydrogenophilaceae bacterium]|jgi:acetyl-CoA C-acetyltransferase|nr:acetyl-CoA acetyltransferase [Hydrogenophilaceae bacterium]
MTHPRTPVLIGAGQRTYRKGQAPGPLAMTLDAATLAAEDAGLGAAGLAGVDLLAVVGFTVDSDGNIQRLPIPRLANPPAALAAALSASPRRAVYTHMGGNTPQALVNWAAELIAQGEHDLVLLVGAEFLGTLMRRLKEGADLAAFGGPEADPPERWGDGRAGATPQERAHGMDFPTNVYPLFENALRAHRGRTLAAHQAAMGRLFAPFSAVAAQNPHAWFPTARAPEEIAQEGPDNRMVGFPYTKYLNAIIQVDQAAAVIMASTAKADALGVPAGKRVYLHGCADANDLWFVSERTNYHSSPAIRMCAQKSFAMAGKTPADMAFLDLYSCFPSAVEIACAEIGLAEDDPRGLTVTGGLPYFGGPGNNYVMHAIATMMERLRAKPGAFGLCTGNGWFLTKHAFGVYSTTPTQGAWTREDPKSYQKEIDALAHPPLIEAPTGPATIETYTVVHARDRVRLGVVIGRDSEGRRFLANTPDDEATLLDLQSREGVGRAGRVAQSEDGKRNIFTPD